MSGDFPQAGEVLNALVTELQEEQYLVRTCLFSVAIGVNIHTG